MIMKTITPRISKAVDIFLDAINNGTLAKGDCTKCAVGNLCNGRHEWRFRFCTAKDKQEFNWVPFFSNIEETLSIADKVISSTDFSKEELMKIEYAFETNTKIDWHSYKKNYPKEIRADQINGLKAVVKVMLTFDDCKENVDEVFTNKAEL